MERVKAWVITGCSVRGCEHHSEWALLSLQPAAQWNKNPALVFSLLPRFGWLVYSVTHDSWECGNSSHAYITALKTAYWKQEQARISRLIMFRKLALSNYFPNYSTMKDYYFKVSNASWGGVMHTCNQCSGTWGRRIATIRVARSSRLHCETPSQTHNHVYLCKYYDFFFIKVR